MLTFYLVWFGQLVSIIGSSMTTFALSIWVFQETGSVTRFAMINLFAVIPVIFLSPIAGVYADRLNRRVVMALSDTLAASVTLGWVYLFWTGQIMIWHIYLGALVVSVANTFQWPAYMAAITQLVPKDNLGRANGLIQFNRAAAGIIAPLAAGRLMVSVDISRLMLIDLGSFLAAILLLLIVRFPTLEKHTPEEDHSVWRQAWQGLNFIRERQGLLRLVVFTAVVGVLWAAVGVTIGPMVLGFAGTDVLGMIYAAAGFGMLSGSLLMSAWGGPRRKINGVIGFELLSGFCFMLIGLRPLAWLIAGAGFLAHFTIALVNGSAQTLWQVKVPQEMQGRVFSAQQMVIHSLTPIAFIGAGVLADRVFDPLLIPDGIFAANLGLVFGVGVGRGIGLMYFIMGLIKIGVSVWGYANKALRHIEDDLPDADEPLTDLAAIT